LRRLHQWLSRASRRTLKILKSKKLAARVLRSAGKRWRHCKQKLKPSKCQLCWQDVSFLGHIVSAKGVTMQPEKIRVVQEWPCCQNLTELREFLGTCGYYRRFIKGFPDTAAPSNQHEGCTFLLDRQMSVSIRTTIGKADGVASTRTAERQRRLHPRHR